MLQTYHTHNGKASRCTLSYTLCAQAPPFAVGDRVAVAVSNDQTGWLTSDDILICTGFCVPYDLYTRINAPLQFEHLTVFNESTGDIVDVPIRFVRRTRHRND